MVPGRAEIRRKSQNEAEDKKRTDGQCSKEQRDITGHNKRERERTYLWCYWYLRQGLTMQSRQAWNSQRSTPPYPEERNSHLPVLTNEDFVYFITYLALGPRMYDEYWWNKQENIKPFF